MSWSYIILTNVGGDKPHCGHLQQRRIHAHAPCHLTSPGKDKGVCFWGVGLLEGSVSTSWFTRWRHKIMVTWKWRRYSMKVWDWRGLTESGWLCPHYNEVLSTSFLPVMCHMILNFSRKLRMRGRPGVEDNAGATRLLNHLRTCGLSSEPCLSLAYVANGKCLMPEICVFTWFVESRSNV